MGSDFLNIVYYVLSILGVIAIGTFALIFVSDLLLLIIAPKRNGVFFNKAKKKNKNVQPEQAPKPVQAETKDSTTTPYMQASVTPFISLTETDENLAENVFTTKAVDYEKAVEEQKLLQSKLYGNTTTEKLVNDDRLFTTKEINLKPVPSFDDDEDDDFDDEDSKLDKDDDISDIIEEVQALAMQAIEDEDSAKHKKPEPVVEEIIEEVVEEVNPEANVLQETVVVKDTNIAEVPKVKVLNAKLIFKTNNTPVVEKEPEIVQEPVKIVETSTEDIERVVKQVVEKLIDEKKEVNDLRKIREDIFNLRLNTFRDVHTSKNGVVSESRQKEITDLEEGVKDKLKELEELKVYKISIEDEKKSLLKAKEETQQENESLQTEVEKLQNELKMLKDTAGIVDKPYYSKEYYDNHLAELELELKDVEKELRLVNREYNPLKRIKKTLDRDIVKLRRKEALVAKQKVRIYGVNNSEDIDSEKLKKLEEEVEILNNLKDSVQHCESVLKQNKDRYPVLEKSNKLLTRHVNSLKEEIIRVRKAIEWYETH